MHQHSHYGLYWNFRRLVLDLATIQRLKEERDAAVKQTQQLQHELEVVKRRRNQMSSASGLSLKLAAMVGLIRLIIGFILKLTLASPT
ncbi:unnamed protein product [Thlaspi arvense]|uniref:Uncharacterized protein n=1 Tax=Thlaspi arvense TaxID=13288 RepID=A0AAU9RS98_THLAR|nr:unnamed protein product [Thlaspi arvense]